MIDNLLKAMEKGPVHISFTSLSSGREIKEVYTLVGVPVPQNSSSNKIVAIHVESGEYEDIEKNTITGWCLSIAHPDMQRGSSL
jgi:hypothetical protein